MKRIKMKNVQNERSQFREEKKALYVEKDKI